MNILSKKFLLIIIIAEIVLSSIFGMYIYNEESKQIQNKFEKDVDDKISALKMQLQLDFEVLHSLKALFDTSEVVTYQEFKTFSKRTLKRHKSIQALEWSPKVNHADRVFYKTLMKKRFPNYHIKQKNSLGKMVKREKADFYFPVLYLEPYLTNEEALGFDLASEEKRLLTLKKAANENALLSTAPIRLVQEESKENGFLTILPIYEKNHTKKSYNFDHISGFVIVVFKIKNLINDAISKTHINNMMFRIYDVNENEKLIYSSEKGWESVKSNIEYTKIIENEDRRVWKIVAYPTSQYINDRRTVLPSMIIIISIVFILFTTFYINLIIQRNKQIESKVEQRTKELNELNEKLKVISRTDPLTKISNRRYFNETIQHEWQRAIRDDKDISLMMIDVDFFKDFNDKYGHLEGDRCLKEIALCLRGSLNRTSDFLARYGGEEFVVILPNTNDALAVAQNCKRNVEKLSIRHEMSDISNHITISIGIATAKPKNNDSLTNFINQADQALYKAKQNGRNCIAII